MMFIVKFNLCGEAYIISVGGRCNPRRDDEHPRLFFQVATTHRVNDVIIDLLK